MDCSLSPMFLDHHRQLPAFVNPCSPFQEGFIAQSIAQGIAEGTEELRNLVVFVSNELESAKEAIRKQSKIHEEKVTYLYDLLSEAQRERDRALDQCAKLQEKLSGYGFSVDRSTIASPNSVDSSSSSIKMQFPLKSLEDLQKNLEDGIIIESLPFDLINGLELDEDTIAKASPNPSYRIHLPEPPESDMQAMLRSLPKRGNLLQAVIEAGPLLQNLLVAGPLPQWKHPPPPALEPLHFDYLTTPSLGHMQFPFKYPKIQ